MAAAALRRRLVLSPTISRQLASRQPIQSFAARRSYYRRSEAAAREEERIEHRLYRILNLPIWAGATLLCYTFYRDFNTWVQERRAASDRSSSDDTSAILEYFSNLNSEKATEEIELER